MPLSALAETYATVVCDDVLHLRDAPGVDGYLFLETEKDLMTGDLIRARVTDAREYDLVGVPEDELT